MASNLNLTFKQSLYQDFSQEEKKLQLKNQVSLQHKSSVLRLIAHIKKINTNE